MNVFPNIQALSAAHQEQVLALWSGLGYYSRARNLHACAKTVCECWGGEFPRNAQDLATLPGIGPSTAAAIAAFCFCERAAIMDANVRRVLSRLWAFAQDLSKASAAKDLLAIAQKMLPSAQEMPSYTQALMDLGASVCRARQPDCPSCPWQTHCRAHALGKPQDFPVQTRKTTVIAQDMHFLWLQDAQQRLWLELRPSLGIWAELYALPQFPDTAGLVAFCQNHPHPDEPLPRIIQHQLTHRKLSLHIYFAQVNSHSKVKIIAQLRQHRKLSPSQAPQWYSSAQIHNLGLPTPFKKLISQQF